MASSKFLGHEPCPACGSRDNLGAYADGKYCFGCGWGIRGYRGYSLRELRQRLDQQEKSRGSSPVPLPDDFSFDLPPPVLAWIKQYGITDRELDDNRIGWSFRAQYLIFPVFDIFGNLVLWQGRYFGPNAKHPKYFTAGLPETVFHYLGLIGDYSGAVCVVEDFVSAVKVGRVIPASPLCGSTLSVQRIAKMSDQFKNLYIWLDKDKHVYSLRARWRASAYFENVRTITTDLDPKGNSDAKIQELLS